MATENQRALVWFRVDLRLHDNPALHAAIKSGYNIIPFYLWAPEDEGPFGIAGTACEVWVEESLKDLSNSIREKGSKLVLRRGTDYVEDVTQTVRELDCKALYFNRRYEPHFQQVDLEIIIRLKSVNISVFTFNGSLLYEPLSISLASEQWLGHWGTLMPFYKSCLAMGEPPKPLPTPISIPSLPLTELTKYSTTVERCGFAPLRPGSNGLIKTPNGSITDWRLPIRESWVITEQSALDQMYEYVCAKLQYYEDSRSRADVLYVSKLSPYLRWGQLSPRALYYAVKESGLRKEALKTFGRRLFWRDLSYFQLHTFPDMTHVSIRRHYEGHEWNVDQVKFNAWKRGMTGFPMVDAGMRELWITGWMHLSVRMIAASFLTEVLDLDWRLGHNWFLYTLVDADVAINAMMWQNAGRTGVDQWNFFSSPESGSQDPTGSYTRRWCPELKKLPTHFIHRPWELSEEELKDVNVVLGINYPKRIVNDIGRARDSTTCKVIEMRKRTLQFNDQFGYDLILVPSTSRKGKLLMTRVFTKQEYRIDCNGEKVKYSRKAATSAQKSSLTLPRPRATPYVTSNTTFVKITLAEAKCSSSLLNPNSERTANNYSLTAITQLKQNVHKQGTRNDATDENPNPLQRLDGPPSINPNIRILEHTKPFPVIPPIAHDGSKLPRRGAKVQHL